MARNSVIKSIGLQNWLNRPDMIADNNGYTYEDITAWFDDDRSDLYIAKKTGRSRHTISSWRLIFEQEKS